MFWSAGSDSCCSVFNKDVNSMLPLQQNSVWNFGDVVKRTTKPTVTGTSVLGVVFDKGVMICADVLGSYGSLARFRDCPRVVKVNEQTVLGAGGDYSDFQYLYSVIEQKVIDEECLDDGFNLKPKSLYCWLTRVLYNRRSKFDPLWNTLVVGGMQDGEPFLGQVDKLGTSFQSPTVATGYGAYLAQPMLRDAREKNPNMTEADARQILQRCLEVLYYRDARSLPKYTLAIVTEEGSKIEGPFEVESKWDIGLLIDGYE